MRREFLIEAISSKFGSIYPKVDIEKLIDAFLDLVIDTLGNVDSAAIVKGFNPVLDTNALNAAKKFKFKPAISQNV
ncbi:MAG: TonB family protein, partial [candidate division WOR-3 bacterium]